MYGTHLPIRRINPDSLLVTASRQRPFVRLKRPLAHKRASPLVSLTPGAEALQFDQKCPRPASCRGENANGVFNIHATFPGYKRLVHMHHCLLQLREFIDSLLVQFRKRCVEKLLNRCIRWDNKHSVHPKSQNVQIFLVKTRIGVDFCSILYARTS